jgi:hypothetical protein
MKVRIRVGPDIVEERECASVVLPDGREGAIWRGLAFALADGAIDAQSQGFAPDECRRSAPPPPYATRATVGGFYVLLQGSVIERDDAARACERAGLAVVRSGRYLGEPVSGLSPDWFLRLSVEPDVTNLERLASALGAPSTVGQASGDLRDRTLAWALEEALSRLQAAEAAQSEMRVWRDHAAETERQAEADSASLEAAQQEAAEARRVLAALRAESATRPTLKSARGVADEIEDALAALLPRIVLVRDSLDVVATEFSSRQAFYRALAEIDRGEQGLPAEWKSVKGASGWIERHVSTGENNAGRLYARLDRSDRRWNVLASFKLAQSLDIDWLKKQ